MNTKKLRNSIFSLILFLIACLPNAFAMDYNFEIETSENAFAPNEQLPVVFSLKSTEKLRVLKPFSCEVKFDSEILKYSKINCSENIKRRDIKLTKDGGTLNLVFNPSKTREVAFEDDKSEIFEVVFTVKNRVLSGKTSIEATFKDFEHAADLTSSTSEIEIIGNPGIENCKLNSLSPSCGRLEPNFSPDVFEYDINLPAHIQNLDFEATPMLDDLSVKISRRKLAAAGKSVDIKISVSNRSPRAKTVYTVHANRANYAVKPKTPVTSKGNAKISDRKTQRKSSRIPKNKAGQKPEKLSTKSNRNKITKSKCSKNNIYDDSSEYDYADEEYDDDAWLEPEKEEYLEDETGSCIAPATSEIQTVSESDSTKIYWIIILAVLILGALAYAILRFIKLKKEKSEPSSSEIQQNDE